VRGGTAREDSDIDLLVAMFESILDQGSAA